MKKYFVIVIMLLARINGYCQDVKIDYSYPPLIAGSSFGNIFQQYYMQANFSAMLQLTSPQTLSKYKKEFVLRYYQSMEFGYEIKLKSWTKNNDFYQLNYQFISKGAIRLHNIIC